MSPISLRNAWARAGFLSGLSVSTLRSDDAAL